MGGHVILTYTTAFRHLILETRCRKAVVNIARLLSIRLIRRISAPFAIYLCLLYELAQLDLWLLHLFLLYQSDSRTTNRFCVNLEHFISTAFRVTFHSFSPLRAPCRCDSLLELRCYWLYLIQAIGQRRRCSLAQVINFNLNISLFIRRLPFFGVINGVFF